MPTPERLTASPRFYKAHGLGNDYLVMDAGDGWPVTPANVAAVCHRLRGAGSDGVVVVQPPDDEGVVRLRGFNPDGSEFERSGNGLRIVAAWLFRRGRVDLDPFAVHIGGGRGSRVTLRVHSREGALYDVSVEMGRARVGPGAVELDPGAPDEEGRLAGPAGEPLEVTAVSVGNPHLVVWGQEVDAARLDEIGPHLTAHPALAHGANVQIAVREGARRLRALIWERGVGPTTASGTSACAVAVSAVHRGVCEPGTLEVAMEGGSLQVGVTAELEVTLRGPVEEVMTGELAAGFVEGLPDG